MSLRYKGAILSATPPTTTGGTTGSGSAPGEWTLSQQMQSASTWPLAGNYIEDVFSTYLYTGNGSTQTITNGIDLAGKGGLVWNKSRSNSYSHSLIDTTRGAGIPLFSNLTSAQQTSGYTNSVTGFTSTGFTLGADSQGLVNNNGFTYASWTFRKQPKFFDVVTYTGNGANRTIAHNLGSVPGCIIVKRTDTTADWQVYHRSLANTEYMVLNTSDPKATGTTRWNSTTPTSTVFSIGTDTTVNANGGTYVAYLFAHNAGGFGLTGTDNVISCGSYTGSSSPFPVINLGFEPQWVLIKRTDAGSANDWMLFDNMRGFGIDSTAGYNLKANLSDAEQNLYTITPTATGFSPTTNGAQTNGAGATYIYIAIRRGPMKTPTSGTSVFTPYEVPASPTTGAITGFVTDAGFIGQRAGADKFYWGARLMGNPTLNSTNTNAESANTNQIWDRMNGWWNSAINGYMTWGFKRAPGFMDVVCYTGNGPGTQVVSHNLGAVPELVINKTRSAVNGWTVFQGSTTSLTGFLRLNTNSAQGGDTLTVSSTSFTADSTIGFGMNTSGTTYVTYLFASCPGVSKVGRFTGTGATQTISCGFAARFVMIKRFDSTGDWWVWDTARGMIAGTDPRLALNSTAAETNANWVYTDASGFQIVTTDATVNASGGSYIFLAIS